MFARGLIDQFQEGVEGYYGERWKAIFNFGEWWLEEEK